MTFERRILSPAPAFRETAAARSGEHTDRELELWLDERSRAHEFVVNKVPFSELDQWFFEEGTGDLCHRTGKFFRIEGIEIETNFGRTTRWMQPIILQPEVGILGYVTQRRKGVLHFLVQAKMEPGNINLLQLSPTVQATRSNFTQVHGGKLPPYLEYFLETARARVLVDQLQSEQGARFLRKRNRNVIVEVDEREVIPVYDDFHWVTLGQIQALLKQENVINMDSRTVLSCIRYHDTVEPDTLEKWRRGDSFADSVRYSQFADDNAALRTFDEIISWLTGLKVRYYLNVRRVPLDAVEGWVVEADRVHHVQDRFFSVVAVSVLAGSREVSSWSQPLIESAKGGMLCFVCQRKKGVLHFLVQGRVEPGHADSLELAPTLQCTPGNYDAARPDLYPPYYELVSTAPPEWIRYNRLQSEEGGRFYHDANRYMVLEVPPDVEIDVFDNYAWMTLHQIKEFIRFNNYINVEARSLLACIGFGDQWEEESR